MKKLIEITIPVLNEEKTLESQIGILFNFLDHEFKYGNLYDVKIVIADNGSVDRTVEISRRLEGRHQNLRYVHSDRRGVGLALKLSWCASTADIIGYMDLDFSTDLIHINDVAKLFLNPDIQIVNGSRLLNGSNVLGRKIIRTFTSRSFNFLVGILLPKSFTDGMCGFKFLRRNVLPNLILKGANTDGWFFAAELLVAASSLHISIAEIPVKWVDDPNSKVKILKLSFEYLKNIFDMRKKLNT